MGTRADFWIRRNTEPLDPTDWIGSIAWDGYPEGVQDHRIGVPGMLALSDPDAFRAAMRQFAGRDDFTDPSMGWPWAWDNSDTTDFAYVLHNGVVRVYNFGHLGRHPNGGYGMKAGIFPDMTSIQNVAHGPRSGFIVLTGPKR